MAPKTFSAAERLLEYYYKEKFFLYIDTWDPHEPWDAPDYYTKLYRPEYDGESHVHPAYWDNMDEAGLTKEDIKLAHDCYCGEVTMVDRCVGRLVDKIKKLGIWDDTMILLISDHGYSFGEHGLFGKAKVLDSNWFNKDKKVLHSEVSSGKYILKGDSWGYSPLYQEIAQIPFILRIPGQKSREINSLISTVDVLPTILDLNEVKIPDTSVGIWMSPTILEGDTDFMQGVSAKPVIDGKKEKIRDIALTSYPLYTIGDSSRIVDGAHKEVLENLPTTITTEKWSMIYADNDTPVKLYNILEDPKQLKNVFEENKKIAVELHKKYYELLEKVGTDKGKLSSRRKVQGI